MRLREVSFTETDRIFYGVPALPMIWERPPVNPVVCLSISALPASEAALYSLNTLGSPSEVSLMFGNWIF